VREKERDGAADSLLLVLTDCCSCVVMMLVWSGSSMCMQRGESKRQPRTAAEKVLIDTTHTHTHEKGGAKGGNRSTFLFSVAVILEAGKNLASDRLAVFGKYNVFNG
jgi:hypothetical protein